MPNPLLNMLGNMGNMNNPIMNMIKMFQGGGNPQQIIQNMVSQNPKFKPVMDMINGKSPQQLQETFYNMCKEKGINPQDIAKQYNINLPK